MPWDFQAFISFQATQREIVRFQTPETHAQSLQTHPYPTNTHIPQMATSERQTHRAPHIFQVLNWPILFFQGYQLGSLRGCCCFLFCSFPWPSLHTSTLSFGRLIHKWGTIPAFVEECSRTVTYWRFSCMHTLFLYAHAFLVFTDAHPLFYQCGNSVLTKGVTGNTGNHPCFCSFFS